MPSKKDSKKSRPEKKSKKDKKDSKKSRPEKTSKSKRDNEGSSSLVVTAEDYFKFIDHFKCWLKLSNAGEFEKMNTDEARAKFENFRKLYNSGRLSEIFYSHGESMPIDVIEGLGIKKSQHAWGFAKKMTEGDQEILESISEGVHSSSSSSDSALWKGRKKHYDDNHAANRDRGNHVRRETAKDSYARVRVTNRDRGNHVRRETAKDSYAAVKRDRAQQRERIEEIVPRHDPGSRESMLDKRREKTAFTHGSSIAKEEAASGEAMDDGFLMGDGGEDSFEANKRRLDQQHQQKESKKRARIEERVAELSSSSSSSSNDWMNKLGVNLSAGKITIAPRSDTDVSFVDN